MQMETDLTKLFMHNSTFSTRAPRDLDILRFECSSFFLCRSSIISFAPRKAFRSSSERSLAYCSIAALRAGFMLTPCERQDHSYLYFL